MVNATLTAGMWAWHVHHGIILEMLTEPIEARIAYIIREKPLGERLVRLRLLKLVKDQDAITMARQTFDTAVEHVGPNFMRRSVEATTYDDAYEAFRAVVARIHQAECPDCPWDGRTIFPSAVPSAVLRWSMRPDPYTGDPPS